MGPMMRRMIVFYRMMHPEQEFTLTASGSDSGLSALAGGKAEVAMMSRVVEDRELDELLEKNVNLDRFRLALDGLAIVVHGDNPVSGLTRGQLQALYTGEVRNWRELGGKDMPVILFGRDRSSGSREAWRNYVMGMNSAFPGIRRVGSNEVMARMVREEPGSIGYVGLGFVDSGMRMIEVNGIAATDRTVTDGSYPLSRTLNLYVPVDAPERVRRFVRFVLGPEGRTIVEDSGFVPVP
eukprot:TRINITY_DN4324_c0_g1_i2.p2 TRINITY_DN4324_c0_g1~~TRINITY_DN4324_c0_g1_i2.p2  ORF type:complete len:238 (+),score=61.29 TRINITY_DN4324_c0_g1_i2:228-941(+)